MTPQDPSSLYSPFFKIGKKKSTRPKPASPDFPAKISAALDRIQVAQKNASLDVATRKVLGGQFSQIIVTNIKASFSEEEFFQMFLEAVREANRKQGVVP